MLEKHLAALKHQGLIDTWHDRRIDAGTELHGEIDKNLNSASIILLLVSSDFIASKYCYDVEMTRAIKRHARGEARVIPVILRACDWHDTPFGKLMAAPKDGKPIVSWADIDEAFLDVVTSIKKVLRTNAAVTESAAALLRPKMTADEPTVTIVERPRSANLRTRKTFTEADRDQFLDEAFNYMASYFENSLQELENRNADLTSRFKRIDGNSFTAVIYQNGGAISRCKIRLGGALGNGISYSANDHGADNSFNENLSVEFDDQHMFLKPLGMAMGMVQKDKNLSAEGASEYYWSMLIQRLQ